MYFQVKKAPERLYDWYILLFLKLLISSISILHIREPKRRLSYLSHQNVLAHHSLIIYAPISASESSFKSCRVSGPSSRTIATYSHLFIEYLIAPKRTSRSIITRCMYLLNSMCFQDHFFWKKRNNKIFIHYYVTGLESACSTTSRRVRLNTNLGSLDLKVV